jgi:hypothetical protein
MITKKELSQLIREIQLQIEPDFIAYEDDYIPGILLTIACSEDGEDWTYQTGDTQFIGSAYMYPIWVSHGVYNDKNMDITVRELADIFYDDLKAEIAERRDYSDWQELTE